MRLGGLIPKNGSGWKPWEPFRFWDAYNLGWKRYPGMSRNGIFSKRSKSNHLYLQMPQIW